MKGSIGRQEAETMAARGLAWIAADTELLGRFLALSGAGPDDLRFRAGEPDFLGFVLDFLLADEETLLAFATAEGIRPELPMRARAALPGGGVPEWT